jgi:hypothetical protein
LQVVLPHANIGGTVFVYIFTIAKALVIFPLAIVLVAILVIEDTLTLSKALLPVTIV